MKISRPTYSLLTLLPLLTLVTSPFPNIQNTSDNTTSSSGLSSEQLERMEQLEQLVNETQQKEEQAPPNANVKEAMTMRLTCDRCDKVNGKYNITVGTPNIDSPETKSIVVNGSVFDMDNTQMGFISFELDRTLDDEIIDIMMRDMNTGRVLVRSFDMSKTTIVVMVWPKVDLPARLP